MRTVHKYALSALEDNILSLPKGAKVVYVGVQDEVPHLWIELTSPRDTVETERRNFRVMPTGSPVWGTHVGTFMLYNATFVGHVYEVPR